jgi:hypothetical protein
VDDSLAVAPTIPAPPRPRLAARDLLVGCVAEPETRYLARVERLVRSIRWFGGEMADVAILVCWVGEVPAAWRRLLTNLGAEVRVVEPLDVRNRYSNKLRFLEQAADQGREMLLLLDCDTLVVRDPLPLMQRGALQAKIAPYPTVSHEVLSRLFEHFGVPLPPRDHLTGITRTPTIPYCNSGVLLVPSAAAQGLASSWRDFDARLLDRIDLLHPCELHGNQASLSLAIARCSAPFRAAPVELNFQLNGAHFDVPAELYTADPAILHYHDLVDAEGFLVDSRFPLAQLRIEAFNRRLREARSARGAVAVPAPSTPPRGTDRPVATGQRGRLFVIGMHRSGTTALVRLLHLMGCHGGARDALPPPGAGDSNGGGEHRATWACNEVVLRSVGASWSDTADFGLDQVQEPLFSWFAERAGEIARELDPFAPWAVKDPRLCLLFPLWQRVLGECAAVIVHRDPLAVARSLAARDGLPLPVGIALWEDYNRRIIASTLGVPRLLVAHRDLLADPVGTTRHLLDQLVELGMADAQALRLPAERAILDLIRPGLQHHQPDRQIHREYLNACQLELLAGLESGDALRVPAAPELSAGARAVLASHSRWVTDDRRLRNEIDVRAEREAGLHMRVATDAASLQRLHARVSEDAASIAHLHAEAAALAGELERCRAQPGNAAGSRGPGGLHRSAAKWLLTRVRRR